VAWLHLAFGWHAKLFDRFAAQDGGGIPGLLSWPFVNMNHPATAMNIGWPIALGAQLSPAAVGAGASRAGRLAVRIAAALLFLLLAVGFPFAHNEYVQWFEETGLIGFALLVGLCAEYFAAVLRPLPPDTARRRAMLLAAGATAAVHSLADFGLRIASNALLFKVVLGVLWRERLLEDVTQPAPEAGTFSERLAAAVAGFPVIVLLVYFRTLERRGDSPDD
jgi:hypothetical protein